MSEIASRIGCIVLAAGSSKRFGSDKRQARLADGTTLLQQTLSRIPGIFTDRILVVRPGDEQLSEKFTDLWQVVSAADASKGMGHSLAAAMPFTASWQGAVIALADMPLVQPATFAAIAQQLACATLVAPFYQGKRGNPVGIGKIHFHALGALQGDQGARALFANAAAVTRIDVDDPGILHDIDTPDAFNSL